MSIFVLNLLEYVQKIPIEVKTSILNGSVHCSFHFRGLLVFLLLEIQGFWEGQLNFVLLKKSQALRANINLNMQRIAFRMFDFGQFNELERPYLIRTGMQCSLQLLLPLPRLQNLTNLLFDTLNLTFELVLNPS